MNKTTEAFELAEQELQTCNCRWDSETQVQQCTLHEAHVDAIHDWAERAKIAEAKLAEQEKQEPVAWRVHPFDYGVGHEGAYAMTMRLEQVEAWNRKGWIVESLYAAPVSAKREWVDLTEGEQESIYLKCNTPSEYINAAIAAFKEKNT